MAIGCIPRIDPAHSGSCHAHDPTGMMDWFLFTDAVKRTGCNGINRKDVSIYSAEAMPTAGMSSMVKACCHTVITIVAVAPWSMI